MCFTIDFIHDCWFQGLLLSLYLVGYYGMHSWLAGRRIMRTKQQGSRILFNIIAVISFLPPLLLIASQSHPLWNGTVLGLQIFGVMFTIGGAFVVWKSFQQFDTGAFLGMKPESAGETLQTGGLYQYSRHPMYFGTFLLFTGAFFWRQDLLMLVFSVISIAYLFIGSRNEEKKLIRQFPEEYTDYRSSTPAIIPSDSLGFFRMVFLLK